MCDARSSDTQGGLSRWPSRQPRLPRVDPSESPCPAVQSPGLARGTTSRVDAKISLLPPALLSLALIACAGAAGPRASPLEAAAQAVHAGRASPRERALAGFSAYLLHSRPDEAAALFAPAAREPEDLYATYGRCELARRSLDTREHILSALKLCELGPRHPLCAVGARIAISGTGESPQLDAAVEARAIEALAAGADGESALLLRVATALARRNRGDDPGARALLADAGLVSSAALLGPYSRFHALEWDKPFPPESGVVRQGDLGPMGPIAPRPAIAYDGHYALYAEPTTADVYYLASDVDVQEKGAYLLRVAGKGTFKAFIDGAAAFERRDFDAYLPGEAAAEVLLTPGRHRLLIKFARGAERGDIAVGLPRVDGRPARLSFAPAQGAFSGKPPSLSAPRSAFSTAAALEAALRSEAGQTLAAFIAVRDALERDDQGAKALAAQAAQQHPSAPLLVLKAEAESFDRSLPPRIGKGRAKNLFEEALRLDPREASVLQRLSVYARSESRFDEAEELLDRASAAASPASWRPLLSRMRLAQVRGVDALADDRARAALAMEPGLCDALEVRYDLARRVDAVASSDALVRMLESCPAGGRRLADHLKLRGDLQGALAKLARLSGESPLEPQLTAAQGALSMALGRPGEAAALYEALERAWPVNASFHKSRAEALERAGDAEGARAEREAALALDGSDLHLRRSLAFARGTEVLEDAKQDGEKALAEYEAKKPPETAPGVYVLDAAAVEVYPDGSYTERTHVVAKVLDQRGVSMLAEVHLPAGAEILSLRTLKKDGRVLEPEPIGGKDAVSLPGVEVGDVVEYEFLSSTGARGAATPGFAAPRFYFQIADGQLFRSVYEVRAPKALGMEVDAHRVPGVGARSGVADLGAMERVRIEVGDVPTFVREPSGPPLEEVLPFVQVGAGAGVEETMASFGDFLLEKSRPTAEIAAFARAAAGELTGAAAAAAVYAKVMQEIKGAEGPMTNRASATLAQGRGSRLMLLKAALKAIGIESRLALVRLFTADPSPYRFAPAELYGYAALQVLLPSGPVLVAPALRFAPFGRISPQAEGMSAALLPEVGEWTKLITAPGNGAAEGKEVSLHLRLSADGALSGQGEERYRGLEAAYLKAGIERLSQDQRRQAIEAAIARTFDSAVLSDFAIDEKDEPGAPLAVRYQFNSPAFARSEGGRLVASNGLYPANLAQRFLSLFERKTPLLVSGPERLALAADIELPEGMSLAGAPLSIRMESPFGRYERTEQRLPRRLVIREQLDMKMARISPAEYPAFGDFVAGVDKAQAREWVFERPAGSPPPKALPPEPPAPEVPPAR
jgi:tetratricopeptide (TPR) repeat protein